AAMAETVDLRLGTEIVSLSQGTGDRVRAELTDGTTLEVDVLLAATGRVPNSDTLNLAATGVEVADDGYVVVDEHQRTTAPGIWALGDICSRWQLKHVANHETRVVQHNLRHEDDPIAADHRFVPSPVFS